MTTFIIVAILMVATALGWILWPLLRPANRKSIEQRVANLTIFKDQFADLDADLRRGSISQDQYTEAKAELERRMLDEARGEKAVQAPKPAARFKTALVLAAAIPIVAGLLYAKLGAPDAFSPLATAPQDQHQLTGAQVEEMTAKLAARLREGAGQRRRLGDARAHLLLPAQVPGGLQAYEKLTALLPNEPALYADYADALAMAQGRKIAGKPMELVKKALELDPNQWKALAMAGTEAFDRKDYKGAVEYWERLKASSGDEPIGQQIQGSIDEARRLGGLAPSAPTAGTAPVAAAKATPAPAAKAAPAPAATKQAAAAGAAKSCLRHRGTFGRAEGQGRSERFRVRVRTPGRRQQDADRDHARAGEGSSAAVHARRQHVDVEGHQDFGLRGSDRGRARVEVRQRDARQRRPRRIDQAHKGRIERARPDDRPCAALTTRRTLTETARVTAGRFASTPLGVTD